MMSFHLFRSTCTLTLQIAPFKSYLARLVFLSMGLLGCTFQGALKMSVKSFKLQSVC